MQSLRCPASRWFTLPKPPCLFSCDWAPPRTPIHHVTASPGLDNRASFVHQADGRASRVLGRAIDGRRHWTALLATSGSSQCGSHQPSSAVPPPSQAIRPETARFTGNPGRSGVNCRHGASEPADSARPIGPPPCCAMGGPNATWGHGPVRHLSLDVFWAPQRISTYLLGTSDIRSHTHHLGPGGPAAGMS